MVLCLGCKRRHACPALPAASSRTRRAAAQVGAAVSCCSMLRLSCMMCTPCMRTGATPCSANSAAPELALLCSLFSAPAWPAARARMLALLKPSLGGLLWRSAKADVAHELGLPPQVDLLRVGICPVGWMRELLLARCCSAKPEMAHKWGLLPRSCQL